MTLVHVPGGVLLRVPTCWTCFFFGGALYFVERAGRKL